MLKLIMAVSLCVLFATPVDAKLFGRRCHKQETCKQETCKQETCVRSAGTCSTGTCKSGTCN